MSGLIAEDTKCSLGLKSSSLFVNINGFVASTLARLCYLNQLDHEVEAVFIYNDNETSITDVRATIGQRKVHREIHGLMIEKDVEESCLRVQDQTGSDFVISIGKIPPNALVLLEVDVLGELETADDGQALVFNTPQIFTPFCGESHEQREVSCRATQAYKFDLKIRTDMPCQLAGCHSPSHAIRVDADADAISAETVIITLAEDFKFDRQIKVYFYPAQPFDVYTSIEVGTAPVKELDSSSKHRRHSMLNTNPQATTEPGRKRSLSNTIRHQECQKESQSTVSIPQSNEKRTELLMSDNTTHEPYKDCLHNTRIENIFQKNESSNLFNCGAKTSSECAAKSESMILEEYTSKLKDANPNLNNEATLTFSLNENEKKSWNSANEEDTRSHSSKTNLSGCQIEPTFDFVNNLTPVNLCLIEGNLNQSKLQDIYTTSQRLHCRDFLSNDETDHAFSDKVVRNNITNTNSIGKDPEIGEKHIDTNTKQMDFSENTCIVDASFGLKDHAKYFEDITPTLSKEVPSYFNTVDTNDTPLENPARIVRCAVETRLNSTGTTQPRSRHFLNDAVIATSFVPDLSNYPVCGEYIFMLDRSGSMTGSHICNAKESLVLFLKSLPSSSYFNVVSFGSYSRSLFPCSQRYNHDSLEKACAYVNTIRADMGGSELLQPLKVVLEQPRRAGYMRNVFVLTDGDVSQPDAISRYLKTKCHMSR